MVASQLGENNFTGMTLGQSKNAVAALGKHITSMDAAIAKAEKAQGEEIASAFEFVAFSSVVSIR